jgi:VanZ family protein
MPFDSRVADVRPWLGPREAVALVALAAAAIIYGSLYPFHFRPLSGTNEPISALLRTWDGPVGSRGDLIANLLFYAPLGLFSAARLSGRLRRAVLLGVVSLGGALLSFSLELAQAYVPGRTSSLWDVYLNAAGCLLGAVVSVTGGSLLSAIAEPHRHTVQPFVALLVLSWLGYRLYPYVPTVDLHKYWVSLKPLILTPIFEPFRTVRLAVLWLVFAHFVEVFAPGRRACVLVPAILVGSLSAGVIILGRIVTLADVLGVGAALLAWAIIRSSALRGPILLLPVLAVLIADRLAPFEFGGAARPFGWMPFLSVLHGPWGVGLQSLLEKFFLYGSLLWLLVHRGLSLALAAAMEMSLLFATSLVQTHIPGRSAEITDTVLAASVAILYALLRRPPRPAQGP